MNADHFVVHHSLRGSADDVREIVEARTPGVALDRSLDGLPPEVRARVITSSVGPWRTTPIPEHMLDGLIDE